MWTLFSFCSRPSTVAMITFLGCNKDKEWRMLFAKNTVGDLLLQVVYN